MQLFIVTNRSDTWYFANNNRSHFSFNADERFLPVYQFAGEDNKKITHLDSFAEAFLPKCTLGQMISRYMVLIASEQKLMMMRPYQIYAVKAIVDCIRENCGNGYIWHTTGSGKTLTSFKASTLLKDNPDIEKCVFVVDRKDLDRQTREEFNRFQEGCVEENTHTGALVRRLLSDDYADKVIVTTIQKLGLALDENSRRSKENRKQGRATYKEQLEPLRNQRMVFIFDECHRSQFGDNHRAIKEFFPNSQLFGFTGTPIFEQNATYQQIDGQQASLKTTADIFQRELHAYTITHAIDDRNVLRFHIDYYKPEGKNVPKQGETLAKQAIVEAILDKHDEHNAIVVANHLVQLFRDTPNQLKTVISTHHVLFFNVLSNEIKNLLSTRDFPQYCLSRSRKSVDYHLFRQKSDTPFFHHVAALVQLYEAAQSEKIYTHHFNMLRSILEKTAVFHGYGHFSSCIKEDANDADGILHQRFVDLLSHGKYSLYEPQEMGDETKGYFRKILHEFLARYPTKHDEPKQS